MMKFWRWLFRPYLSPVGFVVVYVLSEVGEAALRSAGVW
jgi:hypothetical protein